MRMFRKIVLMSGVAIASAVFPAVAQQGQQPAPTEDHGAHHGGTDQQSGQQAPSGGMMGQGMQGGGMMGDAKGGMMGDGKGGMMGGAKGGMMGGGMGGMMSSCPMMGGMMGSGMQGMMGMMMSSGPMMEGGLAYQKAELGITEDQTAAWDGYAAAVKARGTAMQGMHADMMKAMQEGSAPERMDAHIKAMESMVESLKALKPATEALYAVLTDEQKKKADQLLGGGCGMM